MSNWPHGIAFCTRLRLCLNGVRRQFGLLIQQSLHPEYGNQTERAAEAGEHENTEA